MLTDDILNDDTFAADARNDDTFGDMAADQSILPNFFQHHGTTVLEELGHLGDDLDDDPEDDILYEAEACGTGLSDFFKPDYEKMSVSFDGSWMGAGTGEALPLEDEDTLEKELELAQRELQQFAIDSTMLEKSYESSSVTISMPAEPPLLLDNTNLSGSTVPSKGRMLNAGQLNGPGHGVKLRQQGGQSNQPAVNIAPPLFANISGTTTPVIARALSGPRPVVPLAPAAGGPWNKPLPNFENAPLRASQPSRPHVSTDAGRGGKVQNQQGLGHSEHNMGSCYQPHIYSGRGARGSGVPPLASQTGRFNPGMHIPPFAQGPPPMPGDQSFGSHPMGGYGAAFPPRPPPLPRGDKMSSGEVRFVLGKVLDPLKMQDPYCDDFYSIQFAIKKNNERAIAAAKNNTVDPTPPMYVPLPIWKVAKERLLQQIAASKLVQSERTVAWEKKEHVLGHTARLDFSRPRQQLNFDATPEAETEVDPNSENPKCCYGTVLWNMRVAVNRGFNALYTVQELYQLLNTPMIISNPEARADILNEVASALSLLSRSVGILPQAFPTSDHEESMSGVQASSEVVLEGGLVAALLQTTKGKKLITRSMRHLTTTQRWALTPVILARTLQTVNIKNADGKSSEDELVEQRLMKVLVQFVQSESHLSEENMDLGRIEFSVNLLKNLRQCVRTVMVAQMEKSRLREALLSSRYRAEVMHNIIQVCISFYIWSC